MPKKAITRKSALFVIERVFSPSSRVAQTARATDWSQVMDLLLLLIIALIILSIAGGAFVSPLVLLLLIVVLLLFLGPYRGRRNRI